ncbi:hypothetical protein AB0C34_09670 [Nocardia sp. NPDC049220]|uniref:hypothetical protein n=1 Tax=Nocardia sp. NPDC049220 TaxID=3155273 RepID=UPI0033F88A49
MSRVKAGSWFSTFRVAVTVIVLTAAFTNACPGSGHDQAAPGQFASSEGLTVNAAEVINTFGGSFVGPDGKTSTVHSPQARARLQMLVDAYNNHDIPKEAISFKEAESQ